MNHNLSFPADTLHNRGRSSVANLGIRIYSSIAVIRLVQFPFSSGARHRRSFDCCSSDLVCIDPDRNHCYGRRFLVISPLRNRACRYSCRLLLFAVDWASERRCRLWVGYDRYYSRFDSVRVSVRSAPALAGNETLNAQLACDIALDHLRNGRYFIHQILRGCTDFPLEVGRMYYFDNFLYLPYDPSVSFAGVFLPIMAVHTWKSSSPFRWLGSLVMLTGGFLALGSLMAVAQRAPLALAMLCFAVYFIVARANR